MKNWIQEIEILGHRIYIDHRRQEIVFPEDISDEELNSLACYLHEEGFLQVVHK